MILLVSAMAAEAEALSTQLEERAECNGSAGVNISIGSLVGRQVALACVGVGKVESAISTQACLDALAAQGIRPRALLLFGIAGGLNETLEVGDLFLARDCVQWDLDASALGIPLGTLTKNGQRFFPADADLLAVAEGIQLENGRVCSGRLATGDRFISVSNGGLPEIEADAVDMEGAAVMLCAAVNNVPAMVVRVISDRPARSDRVNMRSFMPEASSRLAAAMLHIIKNLQ